MFAKETYMQRRALLKKNLGSGVLLFLIITTLEILQLMPWLSKRKPSMVRLL